MISEVVMPQMGADMEEGTIIKWLKSEGDNVERGEIIAEIETDKANVEIEAFDGGVFRRTLARLGQVVCKTPEEMKAWSQNLGHEDVMTTFRSYGHVHSDRQRQVLAGLRAGKAD
ncbi:MAG: hypothetical protein IIB88_07105 [Chloroflexi bacterium]|nr:hypothetical protein [Chloroflexota bacterium]